LRTFYLYFLCLCLFIIACERKPEKKFYTIAKKTVFVVPFATDSVEKKTKKKFPPYVDTSYIEFVFQSYDLVNIKALDSTIHVDLRYADTNNFLKKNLYDGLRNAYFNCETALKVCAAQYYLKQIDSTLSLIVLDASRPQHIQQMMWDSLKMHPEQKFFYLAPPEETSLHNYGCAIDVTIIDLKTNELLDMGTDFDFFGKLSEPIYEVYFLKNGQLSQKAYKNRRLLRNVMQRAKLNPITSEWWHFSLCKKEEAIAKYRLIR
jgi:D-alanyl-D-alanine dipeptidase